MDSPPNCLACEPSAYDSVDPFLKEALQNPRHRVTILRMELDIKAFMQNPEQQQFEFPHFPTSYLRLAAHRVAHHYGLQTTVSDKSVDGSGSTIIVRKTAEIRCPAVCLSDVHAKHQDADSPEQIKIAIKTRPNKSSPNSAELEIKQNHVRTVEERKEEYDRARARIFSSSGSPGVGILPQGVCSNRYEGENCWNNSQELEKTNTRGSTSRVAIFRDREKDRSDPDYDRSYDRYVRSPTPNQNVAMGQFSMLQPPFIPYETGFAQVGQLPRTQTPVNYKPSNVVINPFCAVGSNPSSGDAPYLHWPNPAMMYAHSYENFRHSVYQAQFHQEPLSFGYSQNQH